MTDTRHHVRIDKHSKPELTQTQTQYTYRCPNYNTHQQKCQPKHQTNLRIQAWILLYPLAIILKGIHHTQRHRTNLYKSVKVGIEVSESACQETANTGHGNDGDVMNNHTGLFAHK